MAHSLGIMHSPLDISKDEIRFVYLLPRTSEEIECELVQVNLNSNPRYEALSYEWGPPTTKSFWISVDRKQYQVRENLSDALRALRPLNEPRLLWVDALCINQSDTMERNHQVARMGEIYKNARRVIVWVGLERYKKHEEDDAFIAISFLEFTKRQPIENFVPRRKSRRNLGKYDVAWEAILRLCQRSYWTRLWIIQEVVLATKVIIQCGALNFTWGVLGRLFSELEIFQDFAVGNALRSSLPARLDQQRFNRKKGDLNGSLFLDMIFINKHAICDDVRDIVFGVHSLVKECCRKAIPVDYSRSPIQLCHDVLRHDFLHHRADNYPFVKSTQRLQTILLGPVPSFRYQDPSREPRPDFATVLWSERNKEDPLFMFSGRFEGPLPFFISGYASSSNMGVSQWLEERQVIRGFDSYAIIPSCCVVPKPVWQSEVIPEQEGTLSRAVSLAKRIRNRIPVNDDSKVERDADDEDLVCKFEGLNFFVVLRAEANGLYIDREKEGPMFKILGTTNFGPSPERKGPRVKREEVKMYLDLVTLQKLCWCSSNRKVSPFWG